MTSDFLVAEEVAAVDPGSADLVDFGFVCLYLVLFPAPFCPDSDLGFDLDSADSVPDLSAFSEPKPSYNASRYLSDYYIVTLCMLPQLWHNPYRSGILLPYYDRFEQDYPYLSPF